MKPILNKYGMAEPRAKITMQDGREVWMCNEYVAVSEAVKSGKTFDAHSIVAMRPSAITINPAHVALVEVMK